VPAPQSFTEAFKRSAKAAGLPPIKLHELRHSDATLLLLRAGEHPAVVRERLGHFDPGFTLAAYTDSVPALHEAAAERGAALLGLQTVGKTG
jgi:integrase